MKAVNSIACPNGGTQVAPLDRMTMTESPQMRNCEELKLGVHALALGVAALCGAYNAAAWFSRRERHLAITRCSTPRSSRSSSSTCRITLRNSESPRTPELTTTETVAEVAPAVAVALIAAAEIAA